MSVPTLKELDDSINLLTAYRDRLTKEVVSIAKKLQMSPKKISSTLEEHLELKELIEFTYNTEDVPQMISGSHVG